MLMIGVLCLYVGLLNICREKGYLRKGFRKQRNGKKTIAGKSVKIWNVGLKCCPSKYLPIKPS